MKQSHFVYNGKTYPTGTNIVIKYFSYASCGIASGTGRFLYYDIDKKRYVVEIFGCEYTYDDDSFFKNLLHVVDANARPVESQKSQKSEYTFIDELNIAGMINAWMWYVFIMAVAIIFHDRILIWIFASIIFFRYRNKKLKDAGYK